MRATRFAGLVLALTADLAAPKPPPYLVKDLNTDTENASGSYPRDFLSIGDRVLFLARSEPTVGYEIWSTAGTDSVTEAVHQFCSEGWNGSFSGESPLLGAVPGAAILSEYCFGENWNQRLWSTDGTSAGTALLPVDRELIYVGGELVNGYLPQVLHGKFLFTARRSLAAPLELWATDGSAAGTSPVAVLETDPSHFTWFIVALDDYALVVLDSFETDTLELWRTDGTSAGTTLLGSFDLRIWSGENLAVAGNRLFFVAGGPAGDELWVSDGTLPGTTPITTFAYGTPFLGTRKLRTFDDELLFAAYELETEYEIWRSDGTASGTFALSNFSEYSPIPYDPFLPEAVKLGDVYYFLGRAADGFLSLWRSEGSPGAAIRVRKIAPPEEWFPRDMWIEAVGDRVVFTGHDGEGWEPFASDGTSSGTFRLADTCGGGCSGDPAEVLRDGDSIFFSALDPDGRRQIWRTDGTGAGTRPLTSSLRETNSRFYAERFLESAPVGEGWVFRANDGQHGFEPWFADRESARLITDLLLDRPGIGLEQSSARGGELAFSTRNDFDFEGYHVYRSDGSAEGSFEIATAPWFSCGIFSSNGAPAVHPLSRGIVVAESDCGTEGPVRSWVRSTQAIETLFSNDPPIRPGEIPTLIPLGDELLVVIVTETHTQFWTTDGTDTGTQLRLEVPERYIFSGPWERLPGVVAIPAYRDFPPLPGLFALDLSSWTERWVPFESSQSVGSYEAIGDRIFAASSGFSEPSEIWATDTTVAGTRLLTTIPPGHALDSPFIELGGRALFAEFSIESDDPTRLWISDGSPEGTRTIRTLPAYSGGRYSRAVQNRVVFDIPTYDPVAQAHRSELWVTDGSSEGSVFVLALSLAGVPQYLDSFFEGTNRFYFASRHNTTGTTFWTTDGTAVGTAPLWTNPPRTFPSGIYPGVLTVRDSLFFVGFDEAHGWELWISTGTPESTRRLADLRPGTESSFPTDFTHVDDRLFFLADDGVHGRELWALHETGGSCEASTTTLCLLGGRFSLQMTTAAGAAFARPLSDATGSFARGEEGTPDTFAKIVNGNAVNGSQWLFVADSVPEGFELAVIDTANGAARTWSSADGELASFADISAFPTFPAPLTSPAPPPTASSSAGGSGCVESSTRHCFVGGRIAIDATGVDFDGLSIAARASVLDLGTDHKAFWFFDAELLELVVRIHEPSPGLFGLELASLTNLGYRITATDLLTGASRVVESPPTRFLSQAVDDLFGATP